MRPMLSVTAALAAIALTPATTSCPSSACTSQSCAIGDVCDADGKCVPAPPPPAEGEGEGEGTRAGEGEGEGSTTSGVCGSTSLTSFAPSDVFIIGVLAPGSATQIGIGRLLDPSDYVVGWHAKSVTYGIDASGALDYVNLDGNGTGHIFTFTPDAHPSHANTSGGADTPENSCTFPLEPEGNDVEIATSCAVGQSVTDFVLDGDAAGSFVYLCGSSSWFTKSGQALTPSGNLVVSLLGTKMLTLHGVQDFADASATPFTGLPALIAPDDAVASNGRFRVLIDNLTAAAGEQFELWDIDTAGVAAQSGTYQLGAFSGAEFSSVTLAPDGSAYGVTKAAGDVEKFSIGAPPALLFTNANNPFLQDVTVLAGGGPKH